MTHKLVRNLGIGLFILSFVAPQRWTGDADFHLFAGGSVYVQTPLTAIGFITEKGQGWAHGFLLCLVMMSAWIANFTIFFRLPLLAALIAIGLPWIAYICLFSILSEFFPYYPWAIGIALIHLSRLVSYRGNRTLRPISSTALL